MGSNSSAPSAISGRVPECPREWRTSSSFSELIRSAFCSYLGGRTRQTAEFAPWEEQTLPTIFARLHSSVKSQTDKSQVQVLAHVLRQRRVPGFRTRQEGLVSADFSVSRHIGQPSPSPCGLRVVPMALQEVTKRLCGILVTPHRGQRLCHQKLDLGRPPRGVRECPLRCLQSFLILFMPVICVCKGRARFPPIRLQLQRFLERGNGSFILPLVGQGHSQRRECAGVGGIDLCAPFQRSLRLRPIVAA